MIVDRAQRWRAHRSSYRPAGEPIDPRAYEVATMPRDAEAKAFVREHHYSGSYPAARFRFGLYRSGALVGVAVFSHPCNDLSLRPLPGDPRANAELGRFVLLDEVPANGETWFLARCFEHLRREGLEGVVSFSDPMPRTTTDRAVIFAGHVGGIYQGANAVYLGRARAGNVRLLPDGRILHGRGVAKVRNREVGWRYVVAELVGRYGVAAPVGDDLRSWIDTIIPTLTRKTRHPGNHKYAWAIDRRIRRHLPRSLAYPKLSIGPSEAIE